MLRVLEVRNLALIDNLTFYPGAGLNVITGETGAGKSLLLNAVSLLLGERASSDIIRTGEESALIQAVFTCAEDNDSPEEEAELIFSREVRRSGPNVCRLNGRVEPLSQMAVRSRQLVDLHGQNTQQSLLQSATQRTLLDAYGGEKLAQCRAQVSSLYRELQQLQKNLAALGGDDAAVLRQADFLRYQLAEIEEANVSAAEEEALEVRWRRLNNAQQLIERTAGVYAALCEGSFDSAIMDQLGLVEKELAAAAALDGTLQNILQQISSAAEQLMDAARELRYYQEELNLDETELQEVSERLETYRRIKQKYGPTISDVEKLAADMQQELAALTGRSAQREELAEKIAATEAALAQAAAELTVLRQQTAEKLSSRINGALQELALQGAKFNILVAPAEQCSIHGCDKIEFQLSANTGEPFHSLAKTASGGEISRVMLAVKSVLAAEDAVDTLIFDEIDAGIGGLTVRAVAEKLKSLAAHRQVICVTHQPLITAAADHHFYIYKESTNSRTATRLKKLSPGEREQELARMLGGEDGVALQHAQELLAEYQKL